MRFRWRAATGFGLVGLAALLAACAPVSELPAGLDPADVRALFDQQNAVWWTSMFPDEPEPVVAPIRTVSPAEARGVNDACILGAGLLGVSVTYEGSIDMSQADAPGADAFRRVAFTCALQYPIDVSDPAALGYLSVGQLNYEYRYYTERLVPCLRSLGFTFGERPTLATYLHGGATSWMPYQDMVPVPTTDAEWAVVDLKCPPPPYLADARPQGKQ